MPRPPPTTTCQSGLIWPGLSDRARRDAVLRRFNPSRLGENWPVHGLRKFWLQLDGEGPAVARSLHRGPAGEGLDLQGGVRGSRTGRRPDKKAPCPLDTVNRQFRVPLQDALGQRLHLRRHLKGSCPSSVYHRRLMRSGPLAGGSSAWPLPGLLATPSIRSSTTAARLRRGTGPAFRRWLPIPVDQFH